MSVKHPIIAITGSSGAGTTTTTNAIRHIFRNLSVNAAVVGGDSFHRFTRPEMEVEIRKAQELEELVGINEVNPYGTTITSVFEGGIISNV